jgi:hypothetical protein
MTINYLDSKRIVGLSKSTTVANTKSISSQTTNVIDLAVKPDGTEIYVATEDTGKVITYELATAGDVSTAVYNSSKDYTHSLTNPKGMDWNNDGTKIYLASFNTEKVHTYTVSTAYNLSSTVTQVGTGVDLSGIDGAQGLQWSHDGAYLFLADNSGVIFRYQVSSAFVVSDGTRTSFNPSETTAVTGISFGDNGKEMYIVSHANTGLFKYTLSTAYDLSTATHDSTLTTTDADNQGIATSNGKIYVLGQTTDIVTDYNNDIRPTDIQDNSILVEKDTGKRYWFSKATVVDDDLTTDKGWVSNTSDWTYNATGDYIDFATVRRSTTAQQIYLDVQDSDYLGSGNNLSDSKWTARFKIRTGAISSSGNVLLYLGFSNNLGDSGTTQQSACMCTNVNGNANENNMSLQVSRGNFETTSTPARVRSDVLSNTNLPYNTDLYMEMIRDGDTFTLKAYTNEYVTQTGATATATVTGISSLRYIKAFTDSEQNGNTSTGARLYDMKITNGSDTWTFPPTLEDNFPSMSGWVEVVTNGNFQVTGNKLVGETQSGNGGTNGGGIYKDYGLGTFDNSKFVLRCKYQILTQSGGSGNACSLYFGISSTKGDGSASSPNANRDGFAITVTNYASSGMLWNYPNDTTWDNSDTDLSLTPTVADYYLEIARTSPTSVTFTLYSDEYNTVVRTHTQSITADLKDLRYLMFQEWRNSSSNTTKVAVSELKLYNKVGSV